MWCVKCMVRNPPGSIAVMLASVSLTPVMLASKPTTACTHQDSPVSKSAEKKLGAEAPTGGPISGQ